jgi:hypothetical protein
MKRIHDPSTLIRIGSASLILVGLLRWFAHPSPGAWEEVVDGANGLLLGIAIATMLLAAHRNARLRSGGGNRPCV